MSKHKPARVVVDEEPIETMRMVGVIRVEGGYCAIEVDVPIDSELVSTTPPQTLAIALAYADKALWRSGR